MRQYRVRDLPGGDVGFEFVVLDEQHGSGAARKYSLAPYHAGAIARLEVGPEGNVP